MCELTTQVDTTLKLISGAVETARSRSSQRRPRNTDMSINDAGNLVIWTIYCHPREYPNKWVLRGQEITRGGVNVLHDCFVADTLDEVRAKVPFGDLRLMRDPHDDPAIYEVWL